MNQITITGNVGKDAELKYTPQGKAVAKFSVAVQDGYGDTKKTYWFDVCCWDKKAEYAAKTVMKGVSILVSGKLTQRHWEKDNVKRTAYEITAFEIEPFTRVKAGATTRSAQEEEYPPEDSYQSKDPGQPDLTNAESEVPF